MKLSTRGARERRRTETARARRHHVEDGRGYKPGTHPSRGRTDGYSARFESSHSQSGPLQRTQNASVPYIDSGGNVAQPGPGQLSWHANPEKVDKTLKGKALDELCSSLEAEGVSGNVISTARVSVLPYLPGQQAPGVPAQETA